MQRRTPTKIIVFWHSSFVERTRNCRHLEARRRLVQLNASNGARAADDGDASTALLWFSEAAKLENDHPMEQGFLRTRLASLAGKHPRLVQVWSSAEQVGGVGFTTDGRWVIVYPRDGNVRAGTRRASHLSSRRSTSQRPISRSRRKGRAR